MPSQKGDVRLPPPSREPSKNASAGFVTSAPLPPTQFKNPSAGERATSPNLKPSTPSSTALAQHSRNTSPGRTTISQPPKHPTAHSRGVTTSPSRTFGASQPNTSQATTAGHKTDRNNNAASVDVLGESQTDSKQRHQAGTLSDGPSSQPLLSPRIKSPQPPASSSRRSSVSSPRQSDSESEPSKPGREFALTADGGSRSSSPSLPPSTPTTKMPRGASGLAPTLETVQEGDHSFSPTNTVKLRQPESHLQDQRQDSAASAQQASTAGSAFSSHSDLQVEAKKVQEEASRLAQSESQIPKRRGSTASLAPSKIRGGNEGSSNLMTVETETVSSIPHAASSISGDRSGATRGEGSGTLRTKASTETIRPKKERKKVAKKPPSIVSGVGSSKADIFEAKVASEIEGEDTDSDETFVYESNPPEPRSRQRRNHSRTPSTTSIQSLADRRAVPRASGGFGETHRPIRGKRSMKFASNSYASSNVEDEYGDRESNVARLSNHRLTPGHEQNRKHMARSGPALHTESPFSHASRLSGATGYTIRHQGEPGSPIAMSPTNLRALTKGEELISDFDGGRADDEQTPLLGSIRTPRSRNSRHIAGSGLRRTEIYSRSRRQCSRILACLCIFVAILGAVLAASGFVYTTTKPLNDVSVLEIQNVLASEQEMLFDLFVEATNANLVTIAVDDVDLSIFAKSKFVSTDRFWRDHPHGGPVTRRRKRSLLESGPPRRAPTTTTGIIDHLWPPGGVDEGTDPIDDPENDSQTMLLGRILHFESSLAFDGSPFKRQPQYSTGELRLEQPGNKTDVGGSERWERVVSHPFELIVRGVLKYQLPLSSKVLRKSIGARVEVHPEKGVDDGGAMMSNPD